jgi:hypothetical protein
MRRMSAAASAGLCVVLAMGLTLVASPTSASPSGPSYSGDFPDPSVLRVGTTYHAYSTQVGFTNIPTMQSPTLLPNWTTPTEALPKLPRWASWGYTWAPSVLANGSSYLMYYTVRDTRYTRQCISVATSTNPAGPFTDNSKGPLVCQLNNGGSIDPSAFVDASGVTYLLWKSDDNSIGHPTHLWGQRLTTNGRSLVGSPVDLLDAGGSTTSPPTWEDWVIEGPSLVLSGSTYYLFYGGNHWDQTTSGIGYATCNGPLGPCTKKTVSSPWMATNPNVSGSPVGPQGPSFFTDAIGQQHIAFDAWTCSPTSTSCQTGGAGYSNGYVRSLWLDTISFSNGVPVAG